MAKIKLVTDSSIQITPEEVARYDIHIIPLTIMIDSTVYVDGETLTRADFMDKMAAASALPKTSQPAIGQFVDLYDQLTEDGSEVLSVHMLESLSGTVNSARQAAEITKGKVTVVDSTFTDRGQAFQVLAAAKAIEAGQSMDQVLAAMKAVREHTKLTLAIDTLENMVKGGRLSRVSGMISSLLNIKVILEVKDGQLVALQKGRGGKTITKYVDNFIDEVTAATGVQAIALSYAGRKEAAEATGVRIQAAMPNVPVLVQATDPVIATHTGVGAFALAYYTAE